MHHPTTLRFVLCLGFIMAAAALADAQATRTWVSMRVGGSSISCNTTGLAPSGSGKIVSFGNNMLDGNTTNGAPTSTTPLK